MKRHKLGHRHSKRLFSRTAGARRVHPRNLRFFVMRGGIRL
ncbi:MAG: hypothetical protein [Microvirus sp.]|nr:MAG: hypothetical protein [Microvirus sp.]